MRRPRPTAIELKHRSSMASHTLSNLCLWALVLGLLVVPSPELLQAQRRRAVNPPSARQARPASTPPQTTPSQPGPNRQPGSNTTPSSPPSQVPPAEAQPSAVETSDPTTDEVTASSLPSEAAATDEIELTVTEIDAREQEALAGAGDDEELKKKISALYQSALAHLQRRDQLAIKQQQDKAAAASAAEDAAELQAQLDELVDFEPQSPTETSVADLELAMRKKQATVGDLKQRLAEIESRIAARMNARSEKRLRLAQIDEELNDLKANLAAAPPDGESPYLIKARQVEQRSRRAALRAEKPAAQAALEKMDAINSAKLNVLAQDLRRRELNIANQELRYLRDALAEARVQQAEQQLNQARDQEEQYANQTLKTLAQENRELAEKNRRMTDRIDRAGVDYRKVRKQLEEVKSEFSKARQREDLVKLPTSVGTMLRNQRRELPVLRTQRTELSERENDLVKTHLAIIEVDEERSRLADLDQRAEELLIEDPTNVGASVAVFELLKTEAKQLLEQRLDILEPLQQAQRQLFDILTETTVDQGQLIEETEEFREYIDQRVLWIRSASPLGTDVSSDEALHWVKLEPWTKIGLSLKRDFQQRWPAYAVAILVFLLLTLASMRAGRVLSTLAEEARRSTCRQFLPTARAVVITIMVTIRNVLPLAFFAWRFRLATSDPNTLRLAAALTFALAVVLPLEFFRQLARRDGVADAHFDWSERTVGLLRTLLRWLSPLAATTVLLGSLLTSEESPDSTTIQRLLFVASAAFVCWFLYKVMHPTRGLPASYLSEYPDGWIARLQPVWFSILVVAPVGLAVLSAVGYVYTANELAWRAYCTVIALSLITTLFALISRALLVNRRAAYIDQARQRYQAAEIEAAREAAGEAPVTDGAPDVLLAEVVQSQDPLADIRAQTFQARRLMRALLMAASILAVWCTWRDVLPALDFMERWAPWQSTATVVEFDELNGETVQRTVVDPVTYVDILIAAIVVVLSLVAARDIPGMAEIMVLNHLPLEKSVKYAITTLISYAIILAGLIVSCKYVGLRWSQIQWMATALTFGLAFGLQEMFANFIAGIIILFERPIRVGDIVTLADVTGVVSRVQIRATTITNWDRKDYIVPNKDFITGRVLNWTLSDHVNRIVVNIGVAYGSDTRMAKQLVTGIARKHPVVVDDPEPIVTFEGFGDSSLTFVLRCYISMKDMPMRLTVIDELHTQIDDEFRKAGIEIALSTTRSTHSIDAGGILQIQSGSETDLVG